MTLGTHSNRVAVVTGAAQGLGEVIGRHLHACGFRVAVTDIDAVRASAVARSLDPSGQTARWLELDVREKDAFVSAIDALGDWGGPDILVNNAAISSMQPVMEINADEFDLVMAVNLRGPFFGSQVLGQYFRGRGHGRIINIASQAGQMGGTVTGAHYAASKAGLILLTKYFAREFSGCGVTVNAVSPGVLDMPAVRAAVSPDRLRDMHQSIPVGRLGFPEEVAAVVALLATPEMGYVTGATWDVNGGMFMR